MSENGVESVRRALLILKCFDRSGDFLTLTQIAERTGLYKSTILRVATSLEREGFLVRLSDKTYALGAEVMRLGAAYQRSFRLEDHIRPILRKLVSQTGESASFYKRIGERRLCLFRENSARVIRDHITEGEMLSQQAGATWAVLTSFDPTSVPLTTIRERMASLPRRSFGERDSETAAVAVPVFMLQAGEVQLAGALSISGPQTRMTADFLDRIGPELLNAGRELSTALGGNSLWMR